MKTCDPIRARKPLRSSPFVFTLVCAAVGALLCLVPRAHAQLPNAWQITDASVAGGSVLSYSTNLPSALQVVATNAGFDFSVNARLVTNYSSSTPTMYLAYGLGTHRFLIWFNLDTNGDLTAQLDSGGPTFILTTNGMGRTLYHTHEIVYDPTNGTASYLFDGQVITNNWPPSDYPWTAGQVVWGAGTSAGEGQMNFHRISFVVTNGDVAAYDAGTENNPTNAPDPVTRGWSQSPSSLPTGIFTNAVSPDPVPLPISPAVTTLVAANLEPYQATLSGAVNPGGLAANAWFEWGTNTNYGNATVPQFLPADTNAMNFSQTITGLAKGATYHFRCVATNTLGVDYGQDTMFTTPSEFSVITLADSGNGSLRQCIGAAQSGDTITFATNGTLTLTSEGLLITNDLTIAGPGPANLIINGNPSFFSLTIQSGSTVTLDSLTISNSSAGGIEVDGEAMISNCTICRNSFDPVFVTGIATLNNCTVTDNSTLEFGAGIIIQGGTTTLNNCTVADNSAGFDGGGIYIYHGTITLNNCIVAGNYAGIGGGIYNSLGIVTLNNCTVVGNSAPSGGGIWNGGTTILNNCTLSGNYASSGGGIYQATGTGNGITILTNTIVAGNTASTAPDIYGSFDQFTLANSLIGGDPLLAPLGNYGGPTQTMPPLFGSPAIDYGDDSVTSFLTTDQRGYPRKSGAHVDIGAVEAQLAPANHPPQLAGSTFSSAGGSGGSGMFQFTFTNVPDADFTVLATTNLALPFTDWIPIGNAAQNPAGQYQFTDYGATNSPQRFYRVVSP